MTLNAFVENTKEKEKEERRKGTERRRKGTVLDGPAKLHLEGRGRSCKVALIGIGCSLGRMPREGGKEGDDHARLH